MSSVGTDLRKVEVTVTIFSTCDIHVRLSGKTEELQRRFSPDFRKRRARRLTTNFDGCLELQEDRLFHEDLPSDLAKKGDVLLPNLDVASARVDHLVDD